ncbi:MAG: copper resistance protein B [Caulobacteraceae bacterium]|nr:copper resistance protein B [Caulobacteraceae bacterium]
MIRAALIVGALTATATVAAAQDPHAGHHMPPPADPHAGHDMPAPGPQDPHAGHDMSAAPASADPHAGRDTGPPAAAPAAAQLPVGQAPAPAPITDSLADRVFGAAAMDRARDVLAHEHGGDRASKLQADLLEWAPAGGAYGWEVEGWWGGDIDRLAFKTEGEGQKSEGVEAAEVQLLYSRALARYTDVQAGLRYDIEPRSRAYAVLAVDTLFPYWFEAEGSLFVSDKGDLLARVEGAYDLRLTQRLILQPRAELDFAAQDIPEAGAGSGLSTAELGLRLRYEIRREFAPYIGVSYERAYGGTADFRRADGEDRETTRFVVGLRAWF